MTAVQFAISELEAWAIHNMLTAQRILKLEKKFNPAVTGRNARSDTPDNPMEAHHVTAPEYFQTHSGVAPSFNSNAATQGCSNVFPS